MGRNAGGMLLGLLTRADRRRLEEAQNSVAGSKLTMSHCCVDLIFETHWLNWASSLVLRMFLAVSFLFRGIPEDQVCLITGFDCMFGAVGLAVL